MTGLRVFQYRTTYVNGTSIENVSSSAPLGQRLRLIEVAYVEENGSSLEFISGSNIWPGKAALVAKTVIDTKFSSHCIFNLGRVPHDGLPDSDIATIFVSVAVMFTLLDVCGLAFALVCLVFNVLFRDKK